jgi:hypothetical protein
MAQPHPGGQSRCRILRRLLIEAHRALGASQSSLPASFPPSAKTAEGNLKRASRGAIYPGDIIPEQRAKSSPNSERNHLGTPSEIKSECRATFPESRATSAGDSILENVFTGSPVDQEILCGWTAVEGQ